MPGEDNRKEMSLGSSQSISFLNRERTFQKGIRHGSLQTLHHDPNRVLAYAINLYNIGVLEVQGHLGNIEGSKIKNEQQQIRARPTSQGRKSRCERSETPVD